MEDNNYPRYIDNKPIGKDQFEGKSHERISTSIAEHIKDKNNSLRVIGIEGEWGSGKSNIIELLRSQLIESHYIYIYDAWGHQEDSQRRAFLEELTDELIQEKILSEKTKYKDIAGAERNITWKEKIKFLLARKRETSKKTIPKLSIGIIIIGFVLLLTPVLTLVADILFDNNTEWWKKMLLPLSPMILSIIAYLLTSANNKKLVNISELFFIFKGKELENTTYEIFSDLDPSVKEFKEWIESISKGLSDKDLIIVYDNMDRLPPEKVKEIWSSIHTFFAEEEYNKIDVIIPFDRKHLQKAFDKEDNPTNEFINKTFSIIYRVTPPVLTDWKDFFSNKFEVAFGDKENKEFPTVLSIFDRLKTKFTPRDIIIFINELVTYKKIWKDEIQLRYIAIFCLKKEVVLESPQKNILNNEYLGLARDLFTEDDKLQNYISALTFNVPVERASQVLLVRDLEITLRGEDSSSIEELSEHPHFIEILEEVIQNSELIVDKAISALSKLNILKLKGNYISERVKKVWDILISKQCSLEIKKMTFNEEFQHLLNNSSIGSKTKMLKYLVKSFNEFKEIKGSDYFFAFKELEGFVEKNKINFKIQPLLNLRTVSPEIFADYISVAKTDYKKYKLATDSDALDNYISGKIPEELDAIEDDVDLSYIIAEYSFETAKENIEALIAQNKLTKDNFNKIINIYKSISNKKPLAKIINVINLHPLLQEVTKEIDGYYDLIAMRLQYANKYNEQIAPHGWPDNTTPVLALTDEETVKEIAKRIESYENYGNLLLLSTTWRQPLLSVICKDLTFNNYGIQTMAVTKAITNFEEIKDAIDVSEQDLLKQLNSWSKDAKDEINIDNINEIIPNYSFFEYSTSITYELTNHINKIAKGYIDSYDEEFLIEEWGVADSYVFNTLYIFMKSNKINTLPRNVFNTLKDILKKISESEIEIPTDESIWIYFTEKSKKKDIAPTIRNIRDYYIRENNIINRQFIFFESYFKQYGKFNEKNSDTTRTILGKLVSEDNCFAKILSDQDFYIPIINNANEDAADFKDNILSRLEREADNTELIEFADKIGVKKQKEEIEENEKE
jgi:KAP family P-loop domain